MIFAWKNEPKKIFIAVLRQGKAEVPETAFAPVSFALAEYSPGAFHNPPKHINNAGCESGYGVDDELASADGGLGLVHAAVDSERKFRQPPHIHCEIAVNGFIDKIETAFAGGVERGPLDAKIVAAGYASLYGS